ncbi:hypothetical protein Acsp05_28330 [Actinokineospora sp. NBRC 105648]|nr:hypothetical protein Acsp05_28330 [Actinokineospora sp. NBRC 105648]
MLAAALLPLTGVAAQAAPAAPAAPQAVPQAPTPAKPSTKSKAEQTKSALEAIKRDLKLNDQQVTLRLAREGDATKVERALREQLGGAYAGSWLNDDASQLVVAVTDDAAAVKVRAAGARPQVVRNSAARLDAAKAKLDAAAKLVPASVPGWRVDFASNSVVVLAADPEAAEVKRFAAAAGESALVKVVRSADKPRKYATDLRGGEPYSTPAGGCSVGFAVQGGYVSAGHCGPASTPTTGWNGVAQGTIEQSAFPTDDFSFVRTTSDWTPRPDVNPYTGPYVSVRGSQEAPVGAAVCRSGQTTGYWCGKILSKNETVNYGVGTPELVYGLTRTDVCAEPGDSGGSFISGDQAQGVTSGGSGNCSVGGTTFFQPVNEILSRYGLTLLTDVPAPVGGTDESGTITGDFNGDGRADVLAMYDHGNARTGLWVFPGTAIDGRATYPYRVWDSGFGAWNWSRVNQIAAADFNGDGKTDVLAQYDYGNNTAAIFVFPGTAGETTTPYRVWASGAGDWAVGKTKFHAGDFNGDGKGDVVAIYYYGNANTGLYVFPGTAATGPGNVTTPYPAWQTGVGNWESSKAKYAVGDFTGDGKVDVTALYNYGGANTGLFVVPGTAASGPAATGAYQTWASGFGNFDWNQAKVSITDMDGDRKADVALLYNYNQARTALFIAPGTTGRGSSATVPFSLWDSGFNSWDWSKTKITAGDFNGDGHGDVLAFYNYFNLDTGLFVFSGWHTPLPYVEWRSGPGVWDWRLARLS